MSLDGRDLALSLEVGGRDEVGRLQGNLVGAAAARGVAQARYDGHVHVVDGFRVLEGVVRLELVGKGRDLLYVVAGARFAGGGRADSLEGVGEGEVGPVPAEGLLAGIDAVALAVHLLGAVDQVAVRLGDLQ